jgi:hypothetical protein
VEVAPPAHHHDCLLSTCAEGCGGHAATARDSAVRGTAPSMVRLLGLPCPGLLCAEPLEDREKACFCAVSWAAEAVQREQATSSRLRRAARKAREGTADRPSCGGAAGGSSQEEGLAASARPPMSLIWLRTEGVWRCVAPLHPRRWTLVSTVHTKHTTSQPTGTAANWPPDSS